MWSSSYHYENWSVCSCLTFRQYFSAFFGLTTFLFCFIKYVNNIYVIKAAQCALPPAAYKCQVRFIFKVFNDFKKRVLAFDASWKAGLSSRVAAINAKLAEALSFLCPYLYNRILFLAWPDDNYRDSHASHVFHDRDQCAVCFSVSSLLVSCLRCVCQMYDGYFTVLQQRANLQYFSHSRVPQSKDDGM